MLLPNQTEGFYLPALEALALGTVVLCPDAIGKRGFCRPGWNCLQPGYNAPDIVGAVRQVLRMPVYRGAMLRTAGLLTVLIGYSLKRELRQFARMLNRAAGLS